MPFHYDPNQPRVPRGHSDGGQWTDGDGGGPIKPAYLIPLIPPAVKTTLEASLALYTWLSLRNSYDRQAIIAIRGNEYRRSEADPLKVEFVGYISQDNVDKICQRFGDTQKLTNKSAAEVKTKEPYLGPAVYSTRVHTVLRDKVLAENNQNFRPEVSFLKGKEETYGRKGSIRIDVLDKADDRDLVCVYDIKTGQRGLSPARIDEIKRNVTK